MNKIKLKKVIRKVLQEMSTTGGGASFSTGGGEQYSSPFAFNPNKNAKGAQKNYYLKLGWKLVDRNKLNKQAKGIEVKHLFNKK
jgi:hypothetical protein